MLLDINNKTPYRQASARGYMESAEIGAYPGTHGLTHTQRRFSAGGLAQEQLSDMMEC